MRSTNVGSVSDELELILDAALALSGESVHRWAMRRYVSVGVHELCLTARSAEEVEVVVVSRDGDSVRWWLAFPSRRTIECVLEDLCGVFAYIRDCDSSEPVHPPTGAAAVRLRRHIRASLDASAEGGIDEVELIDRVYRCWCDRVGAVDRPFSCSWEFRLALRAIERESEHGELEPTQRGSVRSSAANSRPIAERIHTLAASAPSSKSLMYRMTGASTRFEKSAVTGVSSG